MEAIMSPNNEDSIFQRGSNISNVSNVSDENQTIED
jgi:hypothetical protein